MNRMRLILSIILVGWCAVCVSAGDLDEVLAKFYQANGGLEKMKSFTSLTMRGTFFQPESGMEMPVVIHSKMKNKIRIELSVQGQTIVIAYDGTTPWQLIPFTSELPQEMTEEEGNEFAEGSDFASPLITYKEEGHQLELVGEEEMNGVPVFELKLTREDGRNVRIFLDKSTGVQLRSTMTDPSNGTEVESVSGDYRDVDGMLMPFSMENKVNGLSQMKITVATYEINPPLDDEIFSIPKKNLKTEEGKWAMIDFDHGNTPGTGRMNAHRQMAMGCSSL